jgi:hypothetical protein
VPATSATGAVSMQTADTIANSAGNRNASGRVLGTHWSCTDAKLIAVARPTTALLGMTHLSHSRNG